MTLSYRCNKCKDKNFLIECKCGCKGIRFQRDIKGRYREWINGHAGILSPPFLYHLGKKREQHASWKGGRFVTNLGYVKVYRPDHPFHDKQGYILEHRLIMEQYLGRPLSNAELVHHKNENRLDNRIENLQLVTPKEHSALHRNRF